MSGRSCPFWCRVHRGGVTVADRPHETAPRLVEAANGVQVHLLMVHGVDQLRPVLELTVDGRTAVLRLDDAQPIIDELRAVVGMAQRAGAIR